MKLYLIRVEWRYEEDLNIVGIADAEHIEALKEAYLQRYEPVKDCIRRFDIEEFILNEAD
ncbi:MAG: hypothetical protein J6R47_00160 [Acholeplasmatales bacterium]|nr:hypothetical protein [Acholeplasmatales bacterium]